MSLESANRVGVLEGGLRWGLRGGPYGPCEIGDLTTRVRCRLVTGSPWCFLGWMCAGGKGRGTELVESPQKKQGEGVRRSRGVKDVEQFIVLSSAASLTLPALLVPELATRVCSQTRSPAASPWGHALVIAEGGGEASVLPGPVLRCSVPGPG